MLRRLTRRARTTAGVALLSAGLSAAVVATGISATTAWSWATSAGARQIVSVPGPRPASAINVSTPVQQQPVHFAVALRSRDQPGLDRFLADLDNPASPSYHHFLAPGEFASRFGASSASIAGLAAALRSAGLRVGPVSANRLTLPVSGTVHDVSAALQTSLRRYDLASGASEIANVTPTTLPANVAPVVAGIVGLDHSLVAGHAGSTTGVQQAGTPQRSTARADARPAVLAHSAGAGHSASARPASLTLPSAATTPKACTAAQTAATTTGAYPAEQVAHHYGIDALYPTTTGQGVTVGLLELEPFDPADVAAYQTCYGTQATVSVTNIDGGPGSGVGSGEAAQDIENVIGLAPSAKVLVYAAPNTTGGMYDAYSKIAADDRAAVVSISWGLCESATGVAALASLERPIFQQMAAQGQTVLAATGESGSEGCYSPPSTTDTTLSVWDPASQPEVTAVGGTTVATLTSSDTSWHSTTGAGGGGISQLWSMPAYQNPVAAIPDSAAAPCGGGTTSLCREVPDISASADPRHGYLAFYGGTWHAVGGTDAATPAVAAMIALTDSACAAGPVGFINPALYRLASAGSSAIVDVTTGPSNDFTNSHGGFYPTRSGYDFTTGLGRPDAAALAPALCPAVAATGSGTLSVTPNLVQTSSVSTLTFTYTPPAGHGLVNGTVDLTVPGTWPLPTTSPTSPGYTTVSAGVLSVTSNTIVVTGLTLPAGANLTIVYGSTSRGGPGAPTPASQQVTTFAAAVAPTRASPPAALTLSPAVRVLTPGSTAAGQGTLNRVAGTTRIETAIAASQLNYPTNDSAAAVVLARSDTYPDALAGVPLAAYLGGPLLLTPPTALTPSVASEVQRVLRPGSAVFVLGGSAALSPAIDAQLQALGYAPHRIQGADRFSTAVQIAQVLGNPTTVFEADGTGFADALSAGPAAVITHGAVLLTQGSSASASTAAYLATHPSDTRVAVGGPAAHADPTATPVVGADRYQTSVLVAQRFFTAPSGIGLASGVTFPDALSGGPVAALSGGPLVLVPASGALPASTQSYLSGIASSVLSGWLFGGPAAVSTPIATATARALVLVPPAQ